MKLTDGQVIMAQGRIVWVSGDLFKGRIRTEFNSKTPKLNAQGEEMREYGFGLAVPKSSLSNEPGNVWAVLHGEAQKLYPQIPPGFAMKFKDGDGIDDKGLPFAQREGYAGHIVIACTTMIPIKWFIFRNGQNEIVNEGIKCGDYVNAQLQVKAHGPVGQGKPGLYVNPLAVQLVGYGKEIVSTPTVDGNDVFGASQPAVPQGASATPVAPTQDLLMPDASGVGPSAPVSQAQPNYGVLPQAHQPAPAQPAQPQVVQQPARPQGMPMPPGFGN